MHRIASISAVVLALAGVSACHHHASEMAPRFSEAMTLGGQTVSAATLTHGGEVYTHYCRPCHGAKGDGKGPSAPGLRPPPRDFRLGTFKFAAVAGGQLPNDEDLRRIIKGGLHGTPMLKWDVPEAEMAPLIAYLKTFSPRWKTDKPGDPIVASPDPWAGKVAEGIERGKRVYHGMAQCAVACHPNYATKQEIFDFTKELTSMELTQFRDDMYGSIAKDSDYGVKILPPDFTYSRLRSGEMPPDIYRTIASGIGGTAMPTWKGVLPETDLWAMTHYVKSLVDLRETSAADALRDRLANQPAWSPPPPPPPTTPDAGTPPARK